jgi:TolB-like protein/Tfp pilus assembly protein PilF
MGEASPNSSVTTPLGAVFVSYASQDAEPARKICDALRAAGIVVWFDQSELRGGEAWDRQIRKQIHDCALFIPIISGNAHARVEGYFRLEWKLAVDRSHLMAPDQTFLLPVVIDDTQQTDERIPDRFRELQWLRLPGGRASPAFIERVQRLLLPEPSQPPTVAQRSASSASGAAQTVRVKLHTRWSRPALLALGFLLIAGGAYLALDRFVLSKHSAPVSMGVEDKSIAVLPFVDLSEKHDQEYFADGMAEEILDLLAKIPNLKVIGRTSSFQFKGKTGDLRTIAEALAVRYVVEGSVRRSGDHIRVTAQLVDAHSGTHRWSETYDRAFDDVLVVQSEIASMVARELQVATAATDPTSTARLHNAEAYTLYLRGRSALDRGDRVRLAQAQRYFEEASALDPSWSRPAEALAWAHVMQVEFQFVPSSEGWQQARQAAETALRIDSNSASAHAILGQLAALQEFQWARAEREFATALRIDPNNIAGLILSANTLMAQGRLRQAIQRDDAALTLDPLNPEALQSRALWSYFLGDLDSAERDIRSCLTVSPTYNYTRFTLGQILMARGDKEGALQETLKETPDGGRELGLAAIYFVLGNKVESDAAMERHKRHYGELWPYSVAQAHASRNERQEALEWLERAYDARDSDLQFVRNDPLLRSIRQDPRFRAFLRKMNLPE